MLYKVTPMMMDMEPEKKPREPRKRRATAIYDREGNEVLISLMCLKCRTVKPLAQFGLRKMADGAIRNQPWCRTCRSGAGTHKPKRPSEETVPTTAAPLSEPVPVSDPLEAMSVPEGSFVTGEVPSEMATADSGPPGAPELNLVEVEEGPEPSAEAHPSLPE